MKYIKLGTSNITVPAIAVGCMRITSLSSTELEKYIMKCIDMQANFFDHADIYGRGQSESLFGTILKDNPSIRDNIFIQSKCGIIPGEMYDLSKEHIIESVDTSLKRLHTDYLDMLLLHRPDALVEPEEVAFAFTELKEQGKVRNFGVSNHNSLQIKLLQRYVEEPLLVNQLQFSIAASNMVSCGMEVNMLTDGAINRDDSVLDFCRLNDITIQTWSPFQKPHWEGLFIDSDDEIELNKVLSDLADKYHVTKNTIAAAWILRHPAAMQVIAGTTSITRMTDIIAASDITLTREEWYRLYLSAGHILP